MSTAHNLLVVDWDFFFPNPMEGGAWDDNTPLALYDWNHAETLFHREMVWSTRAGGFTANGYDLPALSGEQLGFWERFTFSPRARLFYADSNALAVSNRIVGPRARFFQSVWLYDAHHDCGYGGQEQLLRLREILRKGEYDCSYWMLLYWVLGARLHVRYPRWKVQAFDIERDPPIGVDRAFDDGSRPDVAFDRVFVCRSGAWVPPWQDMDRQFLDFVTSAPPDEKIALEPVPPREISDQQDLLALWHETQRLTQVSP